jgi:uncharacterized membrane protein
MADVPVQVILAAFPDLESAGKALKALQEAKKEGLIDIEDAAVLIKDATGKVKITDTKDMGAGKGATIGAVTGAVIGVLAGPIGWLALGGGAIGGLAAKLKDGGFSDERLRTIADGLKPNSSALLAIIDHRWVAEVERQLAEQNAQVAVESIRDDIARQLTSGNEVLYTVGDAGDAVYAGRAVGKPEVAEASVAQAAGAEPASSGAAQTGASSSTPPPSSSSPSA